MHLKIWMGVPEMQEYWDDLSSRYDLNELDNNELKEFKKLVKCIQMLGNNPKHPGLNSHEISSLSEKYGVKVWQSYLENRTPGAGRIYWVYGPKPGNITVVGIEPHPEYAKKGAYKRIKLSDLPEMPDENK